MPLSLWQDFEARITAVVRALPAPLPYAKAKAAVMDMQIIRGQYQATVDEMCEAIGDKDIAQMYQWWVE